MDTLHILPYRYVKIRHAGFMSHNGKDTRIASILDQLNLPPPMPRVSMSMGLHILIKTGIDINQCKICHTGKMTLLDSLIMHNGELRSVYTIKNRGHPKIVKSFSNNKNTI